ncbi:MAG: molybdate ABC transporter permease subunit, partial [Alphaproteobacteria bacterium]
MTTDDLGLVGFTLRVAALSTLLLLVPGIACGWLLARWRGPGRGVVETLLSLPLVLPPTAVGLALLWLLCARSPLGRAL